jgi:hypothetical protein
MRPTYFIPPHNAWPKGLRINKAECCTSRKGPMALAQAGSILLLAIGSICGCAANKIYVDTDKVSGLGAEVHFPSGKIVPIDVKRVISGNIIELTNHEKVCYIGVYIPVIYNIPKAARELNEEFVMNNQIRLEFDKKERDSKGRLLAYVYTTDGRCINAEIIRHGLAEVIANPPNTKYKQLLLKAQQEAKKNGQGVWSQDFKK